MNTLDELIYYCREPAITGALMLNGEWGCGKTHLVDHELKEALTDTHFIVRVSLFGIDSVATLNRLVRKEWLAACLPFFGVLKKHELALKQGKDILDHSLDIVGSVRPIFLKLRQSALLSDDLYDLIPIQNKIKTPRGDREFILVFDDLERTKLNTIDVLGCINLFCEYRKFKVIIIANEKKVLQSCSVSAPVPNGTGATRPTVASIHYAEIKEKTVARTICCKPDYREILHAILTDEQAFEREYALFLAENAPLIFSIFDTEQDDAPHSSARGGTTGRPRNLRSLKCALRDFYRVYECLKADNIDTLGAYLYNFIVYTMVVKSGEVYMNGDETELDETVAKIYPLFDSRYLLRSERAWILYGDWDEKRIGKEEELLKASEEAVQPADRLRLNNIMDMDEEDIRLGYGELLQDCYEGRLTLNEYILFIMNASAIRHYRIQVPCEIDWDRVMEGIEIRFAGNIETQSDEDCIYHSIPTKHRGRFNARELAAYDKIDGYRTHNTVIFEGNRRLYLRELEKNGLQAFVICENRRFDRFDEEMARATAACYDAGNQATKNRFPFWFRGCWGDLAYSRDLDVDRTAAGFNALMEQLKAIQTRYLDQGRTVSAKHTEHFIETVGEMIDRLPGRRNR